MKKNNNFLTQTWNLIKKHPILSFFIFLAIAGLLTIAYFRFALGWVSILDSGFIKYSVTKIIETDPLTQKTIETEIHSRTWWDWLELLIIPAVLAAGAFLLNKSERDNDRKIAQERNEKDQKLAQERFEHEQTLALDRQREAALQTYFDRMTELLLEKKLLKSKNGDEIRTVAITLTISTMFSLDTRRNCLLMRFLSEAKLIGQKDPIIKFENNDLNKVSWSEGDLRGLNLSNLDFSVADMSRAFLSEANLSGAKLNGANLIEAFLKGANLSGAKLNGADLSGAFLKGADLSGADLSEAILTEAFLEGAIVNYEQLAQTASLDGATLPMSSPYTAVPKTS
jgi:uncharacterized protein YjbI with pentapeptide repeats